MTARTIQTTRELSTGTRSVTRTPATARSSGWVPLTRLDVRWTQPGERAMHKNYLMHDSLIIRFLSLLAVVFVVFAGVWGVSYWPLPEHLLTGRAGSQILAGSGLAGGSAWLEWMRILGLNLAVAVLFLVSANLIITKRGDPFGYVSVVMVAPIFAVIIGTNCFTIPMPVRVPPSIRIFGSSGAYVIMAYALAVAATESMGRWRIKRWWALDGEGQGNRHSALCGGSIGPRRACYSVCRGGFRSQPTWACKHPDRCSVSHTFFSDGTGDEAAWQYRHEKPGRRKAPKFSAWEPLPGESHL